MKRVYRTNYDCNECLSTVWYLLEFDEQNCLLWTARLLRREAPLCLVRTPEDKPVVREAVTMMDVAPTVLDFLGIRDEFGFEGATILK